MASPDPVLRAIVAAARDATSARRVWLLAVDDGNLVVLAEEPGDAGGPAVIATQDCSAGFAASTGSPVALAPNGSGPIDPLLGVAPHSILCVPCETERGALGVLQLVDKQNADSFSFDDVELVTLLAGITGAVLDTKRPPSGDVAPADVAAQLELLSHDAPEVYSHLAALVTVVARRT